MTAFAQRLRFLRKKHRLTQKQLGEKIGVSGPTVTRWEQGKFEPDTEKLKELANLFDVSMDYLLGHDEKDNANDKDNNIIDILEEIKKRPYVIDPKTGRIRQIPERKARIIADIIEDFLREEGKLPEDNEDCASSSI